ARPQVQHFVRVERRAAPLANRRPTPPTVLHVCVPHFGGRRRSRRDGRQDAASRASARRPISQSLADHSWHPDRHASNHAAAGALGTWLRMAVDANVLRYVVGASFVPIALWALVPDKLAERESEAPTALAVFTTTVITFFLAEIGDKTQVATIMLAARFDNLIAVVL